MNFVTSPNIPVIGYPPSSSGTDQMILTSSVTPVSSSGVLVILDDNSIVGHPGGLETPKIDFRRLD